MRALWKLTVKWWTTKAQSDRTEFSIEQHLQMEDSPLLQSYSYFKFVWPLNIFQVWEMCKWNPLFSSFLIRDDSLQKKSNQLILSLMSTKYWTWMIFLLFEVTLWRLTANSVLSGSFRCCQLSAQNCYSVVAVVGRCAVHSFLMIGYFLSSWFLVRTAPVHFLFHAVNHLNLILVSMLGISASKCENSRTLWLNLTIIRSIIITSGNSISN